MPPVSHRASSACRPILGARAWRTRPGGLRRDLGPLARETRRAARRGGCARPRARRSSARGAPPCGHRVARRRGAESEQVQDGFRSLHSCLLGATRIAVSYKNQCAHPERDTYTRTCHTLRSSAQRFSLFIFAIFPWSHSVRRGQKQLAWPVARMRLHASDPKPGNLPLTAHPRHSPRPPLPDRNL